MEKNSLSKSKKALKEYESYFSIFMISMGVGIFVDIITNIPIALMIGYNSRLVGFIIENIAATVTMFILNFKKGYRCRKFELKKILLNIFFLLILQVIAALTIGHSIYFSGPSFYLAEFVANTTSSFKKLQMYRWLFMVVIFLFNYAPTIIFGQYLGLKKHNKDFNNYRRITNDKIH
ncbi:MAG: hypothetical protein IJN03_03000 [Bacilli bacterium]|nr:hypothetical protein [Bacilli bacterium]